MSFRELFKNVYNQLEGTNASTPINPQFFKCTSCGNEIRRKDIKNAMYRCPVCNFYYKIRARKRIEVLTDMGTFKEFDADFVPNNIFNFPDYEYKIEKAVKKSRENEGVITGKAKIEGNNCALFVMESDYIMGSMGAVVGDKITRLFEYATRKNLPVVGVVASGGARMQEGIVSLMQMAKVSGAVKRHSDKGNFYLSLLTHPTTGGVEASFAMLGDVIIAEPRALVGFAGPRVIEQTIRRKLPENFQRAEEVIKCGFIDDIVGRLEQKEYIGRMLEFHKSEV